MVPAAIPAQNRRIFVSIASYRDTECQWTVKDLFDKARHPDRITVGLLWQSIPEEDADCFLVETRPEQQRVRKVHANESLGVCWARHQIFTLWEGEDYLLQIDSHMRFVPEWDAKLIDMLDSCQSDKPVLSHHPLSYTPPDQLQKPGLSVMHFGRFNDHGIPIAKGKIISLAEKPETPAVTAFIGAAFLFTRADVITAIPYDPHLYFHGEEITYSSRLWTHGWDLFLPNDVIVFHDYSTDRNRPRHWSDHKAWTKLNEQSFRRARHLLGIEHTDDMAALTEIERYGLGTVRSLDDYQRFCGINFRSRDVAGFARDGVFSRDYLNRRAPRLPVPPTTDTLSRQFQAILKLLDIQTLCDAGCGDSQWIAGVDHPLRQYVGLDTAPASIMAGIARFAGRSNHLFAVADITLGNLPPADMVLCKDVLSGLTTDQVLQALQHFRAGGFRYLCATTRPGASNLDLEAPPFNLTGPPLLIRNGDGASDDCLGVWRLGP